MMPVLPEGIVRYEVDYSEDMSSTWSSKAPYVYLLTCFPITPIHAMDGTRLPIVFG